MWSSDDGSGAKLNLGQRDSEKLFLSRKLKDLERALEKGINSSLEDVVETLQEQLFGKFGPVVKAAAEDATAISSPWGAHRDAGGL